MGNFMGCCTSRFDHTGAAGGSSILGLLVAPETQLEAMRSQSTVGLKSRELAAVDFLGESPQPSSPAEIEPNGSVGNHHLSNDSSSGSSNRVSIERRLPLRVPSEFASLAAAVQASLDGDRIIVSEGVYVEAVMIDKCVEIVGGGRVERVVIKGPREVGDQTDVAVSILASQVKLCNLTISGGGGGSAVSNVSGELLVEGCCIQAANAGVKGANGSTTVVRYCDVETCDRGLHVSRQAYLSVMSSHVYGCVCGVAASDIGSQISLASTDVTHCSQAGVMSSEGSECLVEGGNIIANRLVGLCMTGRAQLLAARVRVCGNATVGVCCVKGSEAVLIGCDLRANGTSPSRLCGLYVGDTSVGLVKVENCDMDTEVYIPQQEEERVWPFGGFDQWHGDDGEASHDSSQEEEGRSKGVDDRVVLPGAATSGEGKQL